MAAGEDARAAAGEDARAAAGEEAAPQRILKVVRALATSHTRKKHALALLEGAKAVRDAAEAGARLAFAVVRREPGAVATPPALREAVAAVRRADGRTPIYDAPPAAFDAACETQHAQGVLAAMHEPVDDRARLLDPKDPRPLAVLDGLQDPGNLGACLRVAAAFGMRGALLTRGTTDPFAPKVVRAAAATLVGLPLVRGDDPLVEAAALQAAGFAIACAARPGEPPEAAFERLPSARPVALWIGSEGQGVRADVAALAGCRVWLPIAEGVESLNAAVAFGVLAYALSRAQRSAGRPA